jgi:hypothetical protein
MLNRLAAAHTVDYDDGDEGLILAVVTCMCLCCFSTQFALVHAVIADDDEEDEDEDFDAGGNYSPAPRVFFKTSSELLQNLTVPLVTALHCAVFCR